MSKICIVHHVPRARCPEECLAPLAQTREMSRGARQHAIADWTRACFGDAEALSVPQRGIRLLEEAIEAAQAAGVPLEKAQELLAYVYKREVGELAQELGGVSVCVLALAEAAGVDADDAECTEIARVLSKDPAYFAARNAAKNAAGFKV